MRTLPAALLVVAALAASAFRPALADPVTSTRWVGWSDAPSVPTPDVTESTLEFAFANRFPNRPDVKAEFSVLRAYETVLAGMKPGDAAYAVTKAEYDRLKAKSKGNVPGTPSPVLGAGKPVTFAEAANNARRVAYLNAPQKDIDALADLLSGKTPAQLQGVVAAAVLKKRPAVALATLLALHARDARNATHLVNAAGLLSMIGMPFEALAFLDEADRIGDPRSSFAPRAVVLNARGHALLTLGRFADAEGALREAVKLDPALSEAKRNLALALRAQDRKHEAMTFFVAAGRRAPLPAPAAPASLPATPGAPAIPSGTVPPPPVVPTPPLPGSLAMLPAAEVYDLSRGRGWKLPSLKYPKDPVDGATFARQLEGLMQWYRSREQARVERIMNLQEQQARRLLQRATQTPSPGAALADARAYDVIFRIEALRAEPSLKRRFALVQEELTRDEGAVNFGSSQFDPSKQHTQKDVFHNPRTPSGAFEIAMRDLQKAQNEEAARCVGTGSAACIEAVRRKYNAQRCPVFREAHVRWRTAMLRLDGAVAELMDPMNRITTGLASNISDPIDFQLARLHSQKQAEMLIQELLSYAYSPNGMWGRYQTYVLEGMNCGAPEEELAQPREEAPEAFECPVTGEYKLKVDLEIAELSGNCEKIAVEVTPVSAGFFFLEGGAFGELEYAFDGEITVTVGVKVEASAVVTAGAKQGVYVKIGSDGTFRDFGVKESTATGVMLGPIGGEREVETSISLIPG